jgi:hypothetical protein
MQNFRVDSDEFKAFYKALSSVDPEMRKALRRNLVLLAKPVVAQVKASALAIPASREVVGTRKKKGSNLGLRASIAGAVKADIHGMGKGAAVHIRVSGTRFVALSGQPNRSLPYYMEGRRKRPWRHPVFGNRENWVVQQKHPFLGDVVARNKPAFEKSVEKAVNEVAQEIKNKTKRGK